MLTLTILLLVFLMLYVAFRFTSSNSDMFFYALSAVVSLVGINIHFGITLYLSRLVILLFFVGLFLRLSMREPRVKINQIVIPFGIICFVILLEHFISSMLSERLYEGLRQILIYASVMTLFILIITLSEKSETIIKGVKIYIAVGLTQGLYGIYQVIGGPFGWPTYQTLLAGIPTSSDKTIDGFLYSGPYGLFRATGFFPGDVSHFAAYMASVIVLVLALLMHNPRSMYLKLVFAISVAALLLSLSRSGVLSLILFGVPTLLFVVVKFKLIRSRFYSKFFRYSFGFIIILALFMPQFTNFDVSYFIDIINRRMSDLVNVGVDAQGSMGIHILTRLMALDAFVSSPLFGVGLGVNASPWFSEFYNAGWAGSHSHHFDILGQTGLLGALLEWLFMWMVGSYMWRGLKIKQAPHQERLLLAGLFSTFILIIFGNLLYHYFLNDFVWYLLGSGVALSRAIILDANKMTMAHNINTVPNDKSHAIT